MSDVVDNPFFARLWTAMSSREPESLRRLRRDNLAGLTGRVLEVGAGTGTNFEFYPSTVTEVVAVEPERRLAVLAEQAAAGVVHQDVDASVPLPHSLDHGLNLRRVGDVERHRVQGAGAGVGPEVDPAVAAGADRRVAPGQHGAGQLPAQAARGARDDPDFRGVRHDRGPVGFSC